MRALTACWCENPARDLVNSRIFLMDSVPDERDDPADHEQRNPNPERLAPAYSPAHIRASADGAAGNGFTSRGAYTGSGFCLRA